MHQLSEELDSLVDLGYGDDCNVVQPRDVCNFGHLDRACRVDDRCSDGMRWCHYCTVVLLNCNIYQTYIFYLYAFNNEYVKEYFQNCKHLLVFVLNCTLKIKFANVLQKKHFKYYNSCMPRFGFGATM